jgi:hypothetical protein
MRPMSRPLRAVLAAGLLLAGASELHAKTSARTSPRKSAVKVAPLRIRRIRVVRRDLFDTKIPSENRQIYRFVNHLHVSTKESAIKEQLLLKEGDLYNADLAKESERALRGILKLRNVKVTPIPVNKTTVDLLVTVQETWTTEPQFGVSGVGNNLNLKAGIRERNLLGYGKDTSYYYKKTNGIISRIFSYDDPRLLGTPLTLNSDYEDREDGAIRSVALAKPFRASVTPWAANASYNDDKHDVTVLDPLGNEVEKLRSQSRNMAADIAVSAGSTTKKVRRPLIGYRRLQDDLFHTSPRSPVHQNLYHVFRVGLDIEKIDFLTAHHINQYDRDEDFAMGPAVNLEVGAARHKWVRTSNNANFLNGQFRAGGAHGPSRFTLFTLDGAGKFERESWRSSTVKADALYYDHFQPRQTLAAHLGWATIVNPSTGDQLVLGGDTGLRGYKVNQFAGNKKVLANIEDRFFIVDDIASFMSIGWVVFGDAGNVWAPGHDMNVSDVKVDVGTGMRVYLNRTSLGHVLRFDLAYAVKRIGQQSRIVFTFGTSQAF